MHELMGRRYTGCPTGGAGAAGGMMGSGMVSGAAASGGWAAMMHSRDFAWMRDGAWRHMSLTDWQRMGARWMGPGMMSRSSGGWSTWAVLAAVLGGLALGALVVFVASRRPWRHHRVSGPEAM